MPSIFETSGRLPDAWQARLVAQPDTFVPLEDAGGRLTVAGLIVAQDSAVVRPLITLPDRVPNEALQLTQCKLTPIYLGTVNVGWLIRLPAQKIMLGRNYLHVTRPNAPAAREQTPIERLNLKTIVVLEVPDVSVLLLSPRVHEVRT